MGHWRWTIRWLNVYQETKVLVKMFYISTKTNMIAHMMAHIRSYDSKGQINPKRKYEKYNRIKLYVFPLKRLYK